MKTTNKKLYWRALFAFMVGNSVCLATDYLTYRNDKIYFDSVLNYGTTIGILLLLAIFVMLMLRRPLKKHEMAARLVDIAQYFLLLSTAMLLGALLGIFGVGQYVLVAIILVPAIMAILVSVILFKLILWCAIPMGRLMTKLKIREHFKKLKHELMLNNEIQYIVYRWKFFKESFFPPVLDDTDVSDDTANRSVKTKTKASIKAKKKKRKGAKAR